MLRCEHAFEADRAARYVTGDLPEPEQDAFEVHLLECADCARAVEAIAELSAALVTNREARLLPTTTASSRLPAARYGLALAAVLAVLVAGLFLRQGGPAVPSPSPAIAETPGGGQPDTPAGYGRVVVIDLSSVPARGVHAPPPVSVPVEAEAAVLVIDVHDAPEGAALQVSARDSSGRETFAAANLRAGPDQTLTVVLARSALTRGWMTVRVATTEGAAPLTREHSFLVH